MSPLGGWGGRRDSNPRPPTIRRFTASGGTACRREYGTLAYKPGVICEAVANFRGPNDPAQEELVSASHNSRECRQSTARTEPRQQEYLGRISSDWNGGVATHAPPSKTAIASQGNGHSADVELLRLRRVSLRRRERLSRNLVRRIQPDRTPGQGGGRYH